MCVSTVTGQTGEPGLSPVKERTSPRPFRKRAFSHADLTRPLETELGTGGGPPFRRRRDSTDKRWSSGEDSIYNMPGPCPEVAGAGGCWATREGWPLILRSQYFPGVFCIPEINKNIFRVGKWACLQVSTKIALSFIMSGMSGYGTT